MNKSKAVSETYPHLVAPIKVCGKELRNRIIMGSMHTRLEAEADGIAKQVAFFRERARGETALIITGGYSPNDTGLLEENGPRLDSAELARELVPITQAVHDEGGLICAQILHTGRSARQDNCVGPSDIPSPINRRKPRALTGQEILQTIEEYATASALAQQAGFDGVEIMGSEGYLINQFTTLHANNRTDEWGGSLENRLRFPVEIIRAVRKKCGSDFLIVYRISALDLVEGGATGEETAMQARAVEAAGADILNTGVGWHEARVPTIAYTVPRGAWREASAQVKQAVSIPVVASNRINTPEVAEDILASGDADLVSMARPMLADPHFARKARQGKANEINTCIACNQACLDHIFAYRTATCLVNPRACHELEFRDEPSENPRTVAVVGGGAAGIACAVEAGRLGHNVVLFEAGDCIGGQLNLARAVPGKNEFDETLRYYRQQLDAHKVEVRLNCKATTEELSQGFDHVVLATGVTPRIPQIDGIGHPSVATYAEILSGTREAGEKVAVIGSGGIGFDVAEFLTHEPAHEDFLKTWGVDPDMASAGGLADSPQAPQPVRRSVVMLQRKTTKPGSNLGVSTGWILRNTLRKQGVQHITGVQYQKIDDQGLHIIVEGQPRLIAADTIVLCAGQQSESRLADGLRAQGINPTMIGGAKEAAELDAMRAIDEGVRLAQSF